ncbi:MAG: hypothetical protein HKN29_13540, partial [Rhodothermales bacterium]|nr:hypothetical protein [Rhodothermales bacterium]
MAKLIVVDVADDTRVPFLRGVLTRSLQDAGLPFEEAYELASDLRDELSDQDEISTEELRDVVSEYLSDRGFGEVVDLYATPRSERATLYVRHELHNVVPFSKSTLVRSLEVSAAPRDLLYGVAASVENYLLSQSLIEIDSRSLVRITYEHLLDATGER